MNHVWMIGPLMIKEIWILAAIAGQGTYLVLRLITKKEAAIRDALWNALFIFLIAWKLSYSLFHPLNELAHPGNQLYFSGGFIGILLGCLVAFLYLAWRSNKENKRLCRFMDPGMISFLSGFCIYHALFVVLLQTNLLPSLIQVSLTLVLIIYAMTKIRKENSKPVWQLLVVWFSLVELFVSFLNHSANAGLSLSLEQWTFILLAVLISIFFYVKQRLFHPLFPLIVLGGLLVWGMNQPSLSITSGQASGKTGLKTGDLAPDFALKNLQGKNVKLSNFRGKIVILNFWATWCPPCKAEIPEIQNYYATHKGRNVVILGVNLTSTESSANQVRAFVDREGITYPVILDTHKKVEQMYRVGAYPTSYFINKKGIIQDKIVGAMNRQMIQNEVAKIIN